MLKVMNKIEGEGFVFETLYDPGAVETPTFKCKISEGNKKNRYQLRLHMCFENSEFLIEEHDDLFFEPPWWARVIESVSGWIGSNWEWKPKVVGIYNF